MNTQKHGSLLSQGVALAMLVTAAIATCGLAFAADTSGADALEPAVDTSATPPELPPTETATPAPKTPKLAEGVKRQEAGQKVMDQLNLDRTEVKGNQELPKVLYIVPWQKAAPGDLIGKPVNSLLDEVLAPLDREEFLRQVKYYDDLNEDQRGQSDSGR